MLDISKQLLSMNIINQEQLDIFVFNYGKLKTMEEQQQQQQQQQLLAKEVFSPQITKVRREGIIPLYEDETWSDYLIDKSSLSKYNNSYKFIFICYRYIHKTCMGYSFKEKIWFIYN